MEAKKIWPRPWPLLAVGLAFLALGAIFTPNPLMAIVGSLCLAGGLYIVAQDLSIAAGRAASFVIVFGALFLYLSGARWTLVPIVGGLFLLWLAGKARHAHMADPVLKKRRNLNVNVEGGNPKAHRLAAHELAEFYEWVARAHPRARISVAVPNDLDAAVRATVEGSRHAESGFTALGRHGTVGGVTIPIPTHGGLDFAILFHPRMFGSQAPLFDKARRRVYAHEEGHVMDFLAAYPTLGAQGLFLHPTTARSFFLRRAFDFAAEYRADRWMVRDELRHYGHVLATSRFVPDLESAAFSLRDALEELPNWLVYITGRLGEGLAFDEFLRSVFPRLDEVLNLTAYMCAREDTLGADFHALESLLGNARLTYYFDFLDAVRPRLGAVAAITATYDVRGLEPIADLFVPFFHACGLDFHDEAGGLQVHVQTPPFGRDAPHPADEALRHRIEALERVGTGVRHSSAIQLRAKERLEALASDASMPDWAQTAARQAAERILQAMGGAF